MIRCANNLGTTQSRGTKIDKTMIHAGEGSAYAGVHA